MTILMYTDGGIQPHPSFPTGAGYGGTGVIAVDGLGVCLFELATHHDRCVTNQQMELQAAIEGLEAIRRSPSLRGRPIQLHSDSAYLVNCMKPQAEWWYNWMIKQHGAWLNSSKKPVENADLWRKLLSLCRSTYHRASQALGPKPWTRLQNVDDQLVLRAACDTGLDNVTFVKVKGHAGIPLNERADQLATMGKNGQTVQWPDAGD